MTDIEFPLQDITLDGKRYKVKVAKTPAHRRRGLMHSTSIGADGMLFEYDYSTYRPFYMQDTPLPLVIAFFDEQGNFIGSRPMQPNSTKPVIPQRPFKYAIEFQADNVPTLNEDTKLDVNPN